MLEKLVFMIIIGSILLIVIVLAILDKLGVTHIFMKGRPSGTVGSAMRTLHEALDSSAKKSHEYIIEKKEEKDKSQVKTGKDFKD